jgi:crotonobetainyl-CoA:carnitine CoA-transferase CaiB-like acyl-CoA transferase
MSADYEDVAGRRRHHDTLDAAIATWAAERDKFKVMEVLQAAGVPAGAVLDAREMLEMSPYARRGFYIDALDSTGMRRRASGTPISFDGQRRDAWRAAPMPGEDSREVLRRVLGLSEQEIDALEADGVIAGPSRDDE